MTAASSTTRQTAALRKPTSLTGSRQRQTSFWRVRFKVSKGFLSKRLCAPPQPTGTIFSTHTSSDLANVIDMDSIRGAKVNMGVDPLGGAGVHYWAPIAERYGLDLTVVNNAVDPTFRFMTVDWDGQIRMDPSSSYAMQILIGLKDRFDIAFACDTDHDRHGIVTAMRACFHPITTWLSRFTTSFNTGPNGTTLPPSERQ